MKIREDLEALREEVSPAMYEFLSRLVCDLERMNDRLWTILENDESES